MFSTDSDPVIFHDAGRFHFISKIIGLWAPKAGHLFGQLTQPAATKNGIQAMKNIGDCIDWKDVRTQ